MTLDQYKEQLKAHDWYYHMSDDQSKYDAGYNNELALRIIARNKEESGDNSYRVAFEEEQVKHPF